MFLSWVSVRLAGALVPAARLAQVTASPASCTKQMPLAAHAGSVDARPREERAQSMPHLGAVLSVWLSWSALMPAEEPVGRTMDEQPVFGVIISPCGTASQL